MSTGARQAVGSGRRPRYDRWCDADGTHIAVGARVEQAGIDARMGALRSRLHQLGEVTGRGTTRLRVRFDGEAEPISIRPHLVRVRPWLLSAAEVIARIENLRELIPGRVTDDG